MARLIDDTETEDEPAGEGEPLRVEPILYLVIEGARPIAGGGSRHALSHVSEVLVQRGGDRTVRRTVEGGVKRLSLEIPDARMSQSHARITRRGDVWVIEDLGSRNGTRLDGEPLSGPRELRDGDQLELGRTLFIFRDEVSSPLDAPGDLEPRDLEKIAPGLESLVPELAMRADALARVASRSTAPILLLGETGTGKEVIARSIHQLSGRTGKLVAVNCGALSNTLVDSQLFGHVKGAFSGAVRDEPGFVRSADGGTLLLDEIGDLPLPSQSALLRVLQEREVVPVGSSAALPADIRVVAATNIPLEDRVERGEFRSDLYARLAGYTHKMPPLRERREDLGVLIKALLTKLVPAGQHPPAIHPDALRALLTYDWPRNIRELEQCLSVAIVLAEERELLKSHLPEAIAHAKPRPAEAAELDDAALRALLEKRLAEHGGNISRVAKSMGKARMQIQRWMKRFALDPKAFK